MKSIGKMITDEQMMSKIRYGDPTFQFEAFYDEGRISELKHISAHWHEEFQVSEVISGEVTFLIDFEEVQLKKGDVIFINSEIVHSYDVMNGMLLSAMFSGEFMSSTSSKIYSKYVTYIQCSELKYYVAKSEDRCSDYFRTAVEKLFVDERLRGGFYEEDIFTDVVCMWNKLLPLISKSVEDSDSHEKRTGTDRIRNQRLRGMVDYIYRNYMLQISIEDIAGAANISTSEAARCFHQFMDDTPLKFLTKFRIERAKSLLTTSAYSIDSIAWKTGFNSTGYFCRVFKNYNGMTPTCFRKRQLIEQRKRI
jgi:AraC-like DNA-binding protein